MEHLRNPVSSSRPETKCHACRYSLQLSGERITHFSTRSIEENGLRIDLSRQSADQPARFVCPLHVSPGTYRYSLRLRSQVVTHARLEIIRRREDPDATLERVATTARPGSEWATYVCEFEVGSDTTSVTAVLAVEGADILLEIGDHVVESIDRSPWSIREFHGPQWDQISRTSAVVSPWSPLSPDGVALLAPTVGEPQYMAELLGDPDDPNGIRVHCSGPTLPLWDVVLRRGFSLPQGHFRLGFDVSAPSPARMEFVIVRASDPSSALFRSRALDVGTERRREIFEFSCETSGDFIALWGIGELKGAVAIGDLHFEPLERLALKLEMERKSNAIGGVVACPDRLDGVRVFRRAYGDNRAQIAIPIASVAGAEQGAFRLRFSARSNKVTTIAITSDYPAGDSPWRLNVSVPEVKPEWRVIDHEFLADPSKEPVVFLLGGGDSDLDIALDGIRAMALPPMMLSAIHAFSFGGSPVAWIEGMDRLDKDEPGTQRRIHIERVSGNPLDLVMRVPVGSVRRGERYHLSFVAKSDAPRWVSVGLRQSVEPWSRLGLRDHAELSEGWRPFDWVIEATDDEDDAEAYLALGSHAISLDIRDFSWRREAIE